MVHKLIIRRDDEIRQLQNILSKNGITVEITENAVNWVAKQGFDPQFGARPVKRIIQRYILNELSKMILKGSVNREMPVIVDYENGILQFRNG